jgi:Phytanoyl-CoA dioxygenase (PhyH)
MTEDRTELRRLPPGFGLDDHLARLDVDGFTIVEDYLTEDQLVRFREGVRHCLNTYRGRNPFEGLATERVYTLVGRGKIYEEIACDHRLLAILDRLLAPRLPAERRPRHLHLSRREGPSAAFRRRVLPFPRPRRAISISVIGAIDAFMPENGGTVLYRGSHKWPSEQIQAVREAVERGEMGVAAEHRTQLAMTPGAICVFQGTLLHGGGANRTDAPRLAFTNQYCEPWARPQENFFLGVPKEKVRGMSREMQILLGYELLRPANIMGQVSGYHPIKTLDPDFVLPILR